MQRASANFPEFKGLRATRAMEHLRAETYHIDYLLVNLSGVGSTQRSLLAQLHHCVQWCKWTEPCITDTRTKHK